MFCIRRAVSWAKDLTVVSQTPIEAIEHGSTETVPIDMLPNYIVWVGSGKWHTWVRHTESEWIDWKTEQTYTPTRRSRVQGGSGTIVVCSVDARRAFFIPDMKTDERWMWGKRDGKKWHFAGRILYVRYIADLFA